jgi:Flp pilus assembly secretin CpaC
MKCRLILATAILAAQTSLVIAQTPVAAVVGPQPSALPRPGDLPAQKIFPPFLQMTPGLVQIVRVDRPMANVIVGKSEVADVTTMSDQRIAVTAKEPGLTSLLILDDRNEIVASTEIEVTSKARVGRREVKVRAFGKDGVYITHSHLCDQRVDRYEDAPCAFEKTEQNKQPTPLVSTGPVITSGPVVSSGPAR